ncbi:MAG: protein kinase [Planctomycetota bacterium]|nr:protein kinase [Planctomycetota bacterium]
MKEDEIVRILLQRRMVTTEQVRECIEEAVAKKGSVLDILLMKKYVTPNQLTALGVEKETRELGGFRILRTLGQGRMGTIYEAEQISLGRKVALKVLPPHLAQDEEFIQRFNREARSAAAINHPNIVSVIDCGVADGLYYLAMEYVDGENLRDIIKRKGILPEKEALKYTIDIAEALECAWSAGIVHRDVKPHNIMVTKEGVAKLCDLGLAKRQKSDVQLTQPGAIMGSPQYMAPEQIEDSSKADTRSDIYSLGITLFHMVTGRLPYEGTSIFEIMAKQMKEPLPNPTQFNPQLSQGLVALLKKMTDKDPTRRYQTPTQLLEDLRRVAAGKPLAPQKSAVKPPPRPTAARPPPQAVRRSAPARSSEGSPSSFPVSAIVAVAILAVGGIALFSFLSKDTGTPVSDIPSTPEGTSTAKPKPPLTPNPGSSDNTTSPDEHSYTPSEERETLFERIDREYAMQPELAVRKYNEMYDATGSDESKKLIKEKIDSYAGRLLVPFKDKVQNATDLDELLTVLAECDNLQYLLRYSEKLPEVKAAQAEVLTRLSRFIDILDNRAKALIGKGKFEEAAKEIEKLKRVPNTGAVVGRLERQLKEEKQKTEGAAQTEQKRKAQAAKERIRELLAAFDTDNATKELTNSKNLLIGDDFKEMEDIIIAVRLLKEAVLSGIRKSFGTNIKLTTTDNQTLTVTPKEIKGDKLLASDGSEFSLAQLSSSTIIEFALKGTPQKDQRFLTALLLYALEFNAPPEDVTHIFEMAKEVGAPLPEQYKQKLALRLLEGTVAEARNLMAKNKHFDAGKQLSLALSNAEGTSVPEVLRISIEGLIAECTEKSGLKNAFSGQVTFKDGMVLVTYEFDDPRQFGDWEPVGWKKGETPPCSWEIQEGALVGSGKGELKWKPLIKGDVKILASVSPQSEKKTFYIQVCNSGEGVKSSAYIIGFAWTERLLAGVDRQGNKIYKDGPEKHFITEKSTSPTKKPTTLAVAELPKLEKGKSFPILIHRKGDDILVSINGRPVMSATDKTYNKGYVTLFAIDSTISFEKIEILCDFDPVWLARNVKPR